MPLVDRLTLLSKVEHSFVVPSRGCVIVPAVPPPDVDFRLRVRDSIQLRDSDGQVANSQIVSVERLVGPEVKGRFRHFLPGPI